MLTDREEVTAEALKLGLNGAKKGTRTLVPIFQRHNEQLAKLVGAEYASGTLDRYETALAHTVSFLQSKYQLDDLGIDKLNYEFVSEFEFWLKSARGCAHNTAIKYISNLRKVVNICLKNGWLARDPFLGYKMNKREVVREILTQEEIDVLNKKEFTINRLAVVRDLFYQKMNAYLKEIADLCGITKAMTYHTARHTFAATITLTNGVPIETVSKMLEHRSLKTTQHYAKILDKKVSEDMLTLRSKLDRRSQ